MSTLTRAVVGAVVGFWVLFGSWWGWAAGTGAPDRVIRYSGHVDLNGSPMSGPVKMVFHLWDDPTAGTEVFSQTFSDVGVVGGQFAVVLNASIPDAVCNSKALCVAVDVAPCSAPGVCGAVTPLAG